MSEAEIILERIRWFKDRHPDVEPEQRLKLVQEEYQRREAERVRIAEGLEAPASKLDFAWTRHTVGLYQPSGSTFFLKNTNAGGNADLVFGYGPAGAGWLPLAGDWNGDGADTVGLYQPSGSAFFLKNTNASGNADLVFSYGPAGGGWTPLAGDWNQDGTITVGLYAPATSTFFLRNSTSAGPADLTFGYGPSGAGWRPLAGDWNGP